MNVTFIFLSLVTSQSDICFSFENIAYLLLTISLQLHELSPCDTQHVSSETLLLYIDLPVVCFSEYQRKKLSHTLSPKIFRNKPTRDD